MGEVKVLVDWRTGHNAIDPPPPPKQMVFWRWPSVFVFLGDQFHAPPIDTKMTLKSTGVSVYQCCKNLPGSHAGTFGGSWTRPEITSGLYLWLLVTFGRCSEMRGGCMWLEVADANQKGGLWGAASVSVDTQICRYWGRNPDVVLTLQCSVDAM